MICWKNKNQYQINKKYIAKNISLHNIYLIWYRSSIILLSLIVLTTVYSHTQLGLGYGYCHILIFHTLSGRTGHSGLVCVGLVFRRSHVRSSLSAVSLVICSLARIAECNTWSSGGTVLCRAVPGVASKKKYISDNWPFFLLCLLWHNSVIYLWLEITKERANESQQRSKQPVRVLDGLKEGHLYLKMALSEPSLAL